MNVKKNDKLSIVISGSFRENIEDILDTIKEFEDLGMEILSPKRSLETNNNSELKFSEQNHLDAILKADGLYLYNPNGYIGTSETLELG